MDWLCTMQGWMTEAGRSRFQTAPLLVLSGLALIFSSPARAEKFQLQADVQPLALRCRTAAPAFVDIRLRSRQSSILEGILELRVMSGERVMFRQQTRELALAPGMTTQRLLIPSTTPIAGMALNVELFFLTRTESHDLGRFPISGESISGREYVIGVGGTSSPAPQDRLRLWQTLRPEWMLPDEPGAFRRITSVPVWLPPQDLPTAIGLCAFDVIALEGRAFTDLGEKQLAELAAWVEGGGSLCVAPSGRLGPEHLAFLNGLAKTADGEPEIVAEPGGALSIRDGSLLLHRAGLGRLVIATAPPSDEAGITAPPWRRVPLFLAKERAENPEKYGILNAPSPRGASRSQMANRVPLAQMALMQLLPRSARMIPRPVIVGLLGAFVLLVGPGEWLILGWLRRRRWTWITFPLLAISFSLLAVRTAEHYLGRGDQRAALILTDVGDRGQTLRENRLELRFAGRETTAITELRQSLSVACGTSNTPFREGPAESVPLYQGSIPGRYTLRQQLQQWKPQVQRTMSLAPGTPPPVLAGDPAELQEVANVHSESRARFSEKLAAQGWAVQVLHLGAAMFPNHLGTRDELVEQLSVLRETDYALWAAALSPSGRPDLMDLALHDPSDPNEWLVVAVKTAPPNLHIVRRLFRTDEKP